MYSCAMRYSSTLIGIAMRYSLISMTAIVPSLTVSLTMNSPAKFRWCLSHQMSSHDYFILILQKHTQCNWFDFLPIIKHRVSLYAARQECKNILLSWTGPTLLIMNLSKSMQTSCVNLKHCFVYNCIFIMARLY